MAVEASSGCGVARCRLLRARRTRSALEVLGRTASRRALQRALAGAGGPGVRCLDQVRLGVALAVRGGGSTGSPAPDDPAASSAPVGRRRQRIPPDLPEDPEKCP
ncbi:hypothetical protein ACMHYB_37450 [Sorangium sp. So ce1128]